MENKKNNHKQKCDVYNINYFYELYLKLKLKYTPQELNIKSKSKRKAPMPFFLFKKIILTYFTVYFKDLYYNRKSFYFLAGGYLKLVRHKPWIRKIKSPVTKLPENKKTLGYYSFFWYLRPSERFYFLVSLKKLTGSSNKIPQIEKKFKENINNNLIPIFDNEQKNGKENKTLYRCIHE